MKILMIAYGFPPASSSSSFRPMFFARYLRDMGHEVHVLTAREQDYLPEHPKDEQLLAEIAPYVTMYRARVYRPREAILRFRDRIVGAASAPSDPQTSSQGQSSKGTARSSQAAPSFFQTIKDLITESFAIPDAQAWWLPSAVRLGRKIIIREGIECIYSTGGPWTSLFIGTALKKLTGIPLLMDFRDPWVANPYFFVRHRYIRAVEAFLERHVVAMADRIVANTEELRQDFLRRYPALKPGAVQTIPNGFEDYIETDEQAPAKKFTLTHAGALYFSRNPKYILQALIQVLENHLIPIEELQCHFLGGIDPAIKDPELHQLRHHPLIEKVATMFPRLPYQEAVAYQRQSHALLLIQPDFPLQVPRKLYEYMAFRKPILGVTNASGATARLITENKLGLVVENRASDIASALKQLYDRWKDGSLALDHAAQHDKFMNSQLTLQLQQILRDMTRNHKEEKA